MWHRPALALHESEDTENEKNKSAELMRMGSYEYGRTWLRDDFCRSTIAPR